MTETATFLERRKIFLSDYEKDRPKYQDFAEYILSIVNRTLKNRGIEIAYSSARAKTLDSMRKKCEKVDPTNPNEPKYSDPRNQIMDMAGVRFVTYLRQDVPEVTRVVEKLFDVRKEHSQDKLELLGADKIGYLSVHYIVSLKEDKIDDSNARFRDLKCEIQVRTVLEDAWAQIFHDRQYKGTSAEGDLIELKRRTNLISGSLELLDQDIDILVKEYDRSLEHNKKLKLLLDKPLTSQNLISYFELKLGKIVRFYNSEEVLKLMGEFGVQNIRSFDLLLNETHEVDRLQNHPGTHTADQLISCVLIVYNADKFFGIVGQHYQISSATAKFLSKKIDVWNICQRYKVSIVDN